MPNRPRPAGTQRATKKGHILVKVIDHPEFGTAFVRQHHLIWFDSGRGRVAKGYVLHHRDQNPANNELDNLELMTNAEHSRYHRQTGTPWNKGVKGAYSEEHKEKLRTANRNRQWKSESKEKLSLFAKQNAANRERDEKGQYR